MGERRDDPQAVGIGQRGEDFRQVGRQLGIENTQRLHRRRGFQHIVEQLNNLSHVYSLDLLPRFVNTRVQRRIVH